MKNLMLIMIMAMMALCVKAQPAINDDVNNLHEWVDLGLPSGTLWATMNVGASSPEDCGYYFAWGETSTKDAYEWSNYIWCNGSENTLTKYCSEKDYGEVDNRTLLLPEDDAATVNWGAAWRMPTEAQMQELITRCKWTSVKINGVVDLPFCVIAVIDPSCVRASAGFGGNDLAVHVCVCFHFLTVHQCVKHFKSTFCLMKQLIFFF